MMRILLFEKERTDTPGVDHPKPEGTASRTGQPTREKIGLHQVSEPQVRAALRPSIHQKLFYR